ncbi:hypothetical protein CCP3SC15_5600002 [Gammaproteobacteria bacterium]
MKILRDEMMKTKIEIKNRFTGAVQVSGEYESIKQACEKNYSDLRGSNLSEIKNYSEAHSVFSEIVRRQSVSLFVGVEWKCIAVISIRKICWPTIKKQFGKTAMRVFKKLADKGYDEWAKEYEEVLNADKT